MSFRTAALAGGLAACVAGAPAEARAQDPPPPVLDGTAYQALEGARVRLLFAPDDAVLAGNVLRFLDQQPPLPGLPGGVPSGVTAILAHTPEAFDEATGGVVPEWRAGVAIPSRATLVMPTGEGRRVLGTEGRRTLRHEWAHLGLSAYLGGLRIPRWFDEGYAQLASGGWEVEEAWRLRVLLALGRAPPMDSLTLAWPRERAHAETAYLLSASAVTYLMGDSGERGLGLFLERWQSARSFDEALRRTFGVTTAQLEEDWRRHVRGRYGWLFVLSRSAVFWMALALVLLSMGRVRQVRNRDRMARLRAAEAPDQPAYWREGHEPPGGGVAPPS